MSNTMMALVTNVIGILVLNQKPSTGGELLRVPLESLKKVNTYFAVLDINSHTKFHTKKHRNCNF